MTETENPTRDELKTRLLAAQVARAEFRLQAEKLMAAQNERNEKRRLALLPLENMYNLNEPVGPGSVAYVTKWLDTRSLQEPNARLELRISSPGGSVFDGLALMDMMKFARSRGNHLTVVIQGMAASMAGIIAQAADHRVIARDAYLMIHTVSQIVVARMDTAAFTDEAELCKRLTLQGCQAYAERSGGKWTAEALYDKTLRKDWWLTAAEALAEGFVDEIR